MSPTFTDNDGNLDWRKVGYHARSAFAVILSLAVLIGGGWFVYSKASDAWTSWRSADDFVGEGDSPVDILIPMGASLTQIGDILVENEVVKSTKAFRSEANKNPDSSLIQAGRYTLLTELPAETALDMLLDPENMVHVRVTITEGLTLQQQWAAINKELEVPVEDMQEAVETADLNLPAWSDGEREGFMFPDTYQVAEPVNPVQIAQSQANQFTKVTSELNIETRAEELGITPFEAITVASLIEREVGAPEDMKKVATVIYNRLDEDMRLQFDSTVHYALGDFEKVTTTSEDRKVDSPYNTYRYRGLPPGPIGNPGKAAIEAALNPTEGDWVYFVTVDLDTGETLFASNGEGHQENVLKFQAWCQAHEGRCG